MSTEFQTPKPLPYSCTKAELQRMYGTQMADSFITSEINTIIKEKRKITNEAAPKVSKITHVEFMEFVDTWGVPKGYYKPKEYENRTA